MIDTIDIYHYSPCRARGRSCRRRLGFDDAAELLVDEKAVVRGARPGSERTDGDPQPGRQVAARARWDDPSARPAPPRRYSPTETIPKLARFHSPCDRS